MGHSLILYDGSDLRRAEHWATLPLDERRRRAMLACRDRDTDLLWELTEAYLVLRSEAGSKLSTHTRQSYRSAIRQLVTAWKGERLHDPAPEAGRLWVRQLERGGYARSTIGTRLAGVRNLYAALRWCGVTERDPFDGVRPARDSTPAWERRKPYADGDVDRLLSVATDPADHVLVLLGAHAGLRAFEATALRWDDVDLQERTLVVARGKNGKRRTCQLSQALTVALAALKTTQGDGWVLPYRSTRTGRRRLEKLCAATGVKYRSLHSLRHSCGTRLKREGADLDTIAQQLGHARIDTTRIYVHYVADELRQRVSSW